MKHEKLYSFLMGIAIILVLLGEWAIILKVGQKREWWQIGHLQLGRPHWSRVADEVHQKPVSKSNMKPLILTNHVRFED